MRVLISTVLATALFASSAIAADGALAPGKPAGVKQAQMTDNELYIALGATAVAVGILVAATNHTSSNQSTTATSTAP